VQLKDPNDSERLIALKNVSVDHPGSDEVILVLGQDDAKTALRMPFTVKVADELISKLRDIFDPASVAVK
jgi:hypothetical protein